MKNVESQQLTVPGKDIDSAPSEMPTITEVDGQSSVNIHDLTPMEIEALKTFRKEVIARGGEPDQILGEFGKTMRKYKPQGGTRKDKYNNNTYVAKWLDNQAEYLHKKLKLNK